MPASADLDVLRQSLAARSALSAEESEQLTAVVDAFPGVTQLEARLDVLLHAVRLLYSEGFGAEAVRVAERAVHLARQGADAGYLQKSLAYLGIAHIEALDSARALEALTESVEVARQCASPGIEMVLWCNIGLALQRAGQYDDAVACHEHVLSRADEPDPRHARALSLSNLADLWHGLGDTARALDAVRRRAREAFEPQGVTDWHGEVSHAATAAKVFLEAGLVQDAREQVRRCAAGAARAPSLRSDINATIAEALYRAYTGSAAEAIVMLEAAAARARSPVLQHDLLHALSKAHELAGHPQDALRYFLEKIEVLRRWRVDSALSLLRSHRPPQMARQAPDAFSRLRQREAELRGKLRGVDQDDEAMELLERMAVTAELREDPSGLHCYRVGRLSALLARECGVEADEADAIGRAARLHDIGKIGIADEIILKRAPLSEREREIIASHTRSGGEFVAASDISARGLALDVVRHHHDWWDGAHGLEKAQRIPLAARIVAVAEVFDALTHERPHRGAWPRERVLRHIAAAGGSQLDPRIVEVFLALIARLAGQHPDLDSFLAQDAGGSGFLRVRARIRAQLGTDAA